LHGKLPEIPESDLILVAGDICRDASPEVQLNYLTGDFNKWCKDQSGPVMCIAGNHDHACELYPDDLFKEYDYYYMRDDSYHLNINGESVNVYGSPWSLKFGDYSFQCGEKRMQMVCEMIPDNVDILLTHGPCYGIMDGAPRANKKGGFEHTGSHTLLNRVLEVYPKLHVFGHIHEGYGVRHWVDQIGEIAFVNAAHRNGDFTATHKPITVEL